MFAMSGNPAAVAMHDTRTAAVSGTGSVLHLLLLLWTLQQRSERMSVLIQLLATVVADRGVQSLSDTWWTALAVDVLTRYCCSC